MSARIAGFDVARALAVFGMVVVNFKIAMGASNGNAWLLSFASLFEGRASALFVVLAGIGVSLLTRRARLPADLAVISRERRSLCRRGGLLIVIGLLYTPIWEADILHFYGFYFLCAAALITASERRLLLAAGALIALFPILLVLFDYERHWDWASLTYNNLWTIDGLLRHTFFNGYHPVVPWAAFLFIGMWLGRLELNDSAVRLRLLRVALLSLVTCEALMLLLRYWLIDNTLIDNTSAAEELVFLLSVSPIPPLPQYMISATSSAVLALLACLYFADRYADSRLQRWLGQTGQLSLTLYVAHVIIGMGLLEAKGLLESNASIEAVLLCALLFCIGAVAFSVLWLHYFKQGPLEALFRRLAG